MSLLHQLSDFLNYNSTINPAPPTYYYQGEGLQLPRTSLVEAIASGLMQQLSQNDSYSREGKMYGVLLVELPTGEQRVVKAFSGLLHGESLVEGWVPPIPGREAVAHIEAHTLAELATLKQEIITLSQLPIRQEYVTLAAEFEQQLQAINERHRAAKTQRQETRQQLGETLTGTSLQTALAQLDAASQQQGMELRNLKRQRQELLQPLQQLISTADTQIQELKQRRKHLSRQLQAQMYAAYSLTNFSGQSHSLQELLPHGAPTGTGDCCAPKLLHYAATHQLKPLAMAEFWWGTTTDDKVQGQFYGACAERCQPLMGFLLRGSQGGATEEISIIYEDQWLIAINKPPGLLSVPGRYHYNQDSVLNRLRHRHISLTAVHRLDQETSGILLLTTDSQTHRQLSRQFQQRQVCKVYEAILAGPVTPTQGVIELPLWGDPQKRPYQQVDWQRGRPSLTRFQVMDQVGDYTRVEFVPLTGRTHQLRVHAADPQGLGVRILGDRLYGCTAFTSRLHLHAREIRFEHPHSLQTLHLQIKTPF